MEYLGLVWYDFPFNNIKHFVAAQLGNTRSVFEMDNFENLPYNKMNKVKSDICRSIRKK